MFNAEGSSKPTNAVNKILKTLLQNLSLLDAHSLFIMYDKILDRNSSDSGINTVEVIIESPNLLKDLKKFF